MLEKILKFLSGKKGVIASLIGLVSTYLAIKGYIGEPEIYLITGISVILFGTASYATKKIVYK